MNKKNLNELIILYQLAEDLAANDLEDEGLLLMLLQMAKAYLDIAKEHSISHIEVASYLPIRVNEKLDNEELNVVFVEKQKTLVKKMN